MTEETRKELVRDLSAALEFVRDSVVFPWDDDYATEVRLQLLPDDVWHLHTGDPQFDTDHTGHWGHGEVTPGTDCDSLAAELLDEALDSRAMCGGAGDGTDEHDVTPLKPDLGGEGG